MPSPCRNTVRVSGDARDGRIDGGYRLDKRPRASVPYSLNEPLFSAHSYHLSMKRISEVLFDTGPALRHWSIRFGVDQ